MALLVRETEDRWRCSSCGRYVDDPGEPRMFHFSEGPIASFALPQYHTVERRVGSGVRGVYGSRMEPSECGPIKPVKVCVNEQFMEFATGAEP